MPRPGLVFCVHETYYLNMKEMRNTVPKFICDQVNKNRKGRFKKAVMFADISGFTSLTESLMKKGKYGAEIISNILNELFNHIENAVYANNGFIATFAGDAFTGIFDNPESAVKCGQNIQHFMKQKKAIEIDQISVKMSIKIGISYGNVSWGIPGAYPLHTFYFKGKTINRAVDCEALCNPGDIIMDRAAFNSCNGSISCYPASNAYLITNDNYIPDSVIAKIPFANNQHLFSNCYEAIMEAENEFRETVNLFINFRDFGNYSQLFDFIEQIVNLVSVAGGYLNSLDFGDKGNKILVLFGAPLSMGNNVERALSLVDELRNKYRTRIKAGITMGTVFAGYVGNKRCTYTALGDAVNLSARLMAIGEWGDMLSDSKFADNADNIRQFARLGDVNIKGKEKAVTVYSVKEEKQNQFTDTQIIGRHNEVKCIEKQISKAISGEESSIVILEGETGSGKTMLIEYILKHSNWNINIVKMHCDSVFKRSLNPFSMYFKNLLVPDGDVSTFDTHWKELNEQISVIRERKAVIADLAGVFIQEQDYHNLPPKDKFQLKLFTLRDYFRNVIKNPSIIIIDNFDKADADTVEAVRTVFRNSTHMKYCLILIGSVIHDDSISGQSGVKSTQLILENLNYEEICRLAESELSASVTERFNTLVYNRSGGNPFFAVQLIGYLKTNGLIENKDGIYDLIKENADIPSQLNNILVARVDSLNRELKEAVKYAAVLGVEFQNTVLKEMLEKSNVGKAVNMGISEDIWNAINEIDFIFKQGVFRDAVYGMQMKKRLLKLHLKAAVILRMLYSDSREHLYKIAYHYDKAQYSNEAYIYYKQASEWAAENFRNNENREILNRMLELTNKSEEMAYIHACLGDLYFYEGELDAAASEYSISEKLGKQSGNMELSARAIMGNTEILRIRGKYNKCIKSAERVIKIAQQSNDIKNEVRALMMMGAIHMTQGKMDTAKTMFMKAEQIALHHNHEELYESLYTNLGNFHWNLSHYEDAIDAFKKAINVSEKRHSIESLCSSYANIGGVYWYKGEINKAEQYFNKALDISQKAGIKRIAAVVTGNMAAIYETRGQYDKAIASLKKRRNIAEEMNDRKGKAYAILNTGIIYHDMMDLKRAEKYYEESLYIFREMEVRYGTGVVLGNLGTINLLRGNVEKATECFMQKLDIADKAGDEKMIANAYSLIGDLMMHTGCYDDAFDSYEKALDIAKKLDVGKKIVSDMCAMGTIMRIKKDWEKAERLLGQALSRASSMDAHAQICEIYCEMALMNRDMGKCNEAEMSAENAVNASLKINSINKKLYALLVQADIVAHKSKESTLKQIQDVKTDDMHINAYKQYLLCRISKDGRVCDKARLFIENTYTVTKKIQYKEYLKDIENWINQSINTHID